MIIYEFWLKEQFKTQAFEALCSAFYKLGNVGELRKTDGVEGSAVYSVSRNLNTHWVQLLVDDNTPEAIITAIEARINGLKDDEPLRKYDDELHDNSPMEMPRHFSLARVLEVRRRQKEGTLGRIEDVQIDQL